VSETWSVLMFVFAHFKPSGRIDMTRTVIILVYLKSANVSLKVPSSNLFHFCLSIQNTNLYKFFSFQRV